MLSKVFAASFSKKVLHSRLYSLLVTNCDFGTEYETHHIKTSRFQKFVLSLGASTVSLFDPSRGDMIATLGETTGQNALEFIHEKMQQNPEGNSILLEKPRINSSTVDLKKLSMLPEGTVGKVYHNFLEDNKVTPDSRPMVQFIDNCELAYVMQRYREVHDLVHAVLGMPTNMLGEVTVKWVEGIQTRLPMCIGGGLFGAVRLRPKQRKKYISTYLPWAIKTGMNSKFLMNVYYEKRWEQPISEFHMEMNITPLKKKVKKQERT